MGFPTIQFKRGAFLDVPDLKAGEPGFTTDKYDLFIGTDELSYTSNQFYGSGRYWEREDGSTSLRFNLVDKDGVKSLSFASPNTLSGSGTFVFPDTTDGQAGDSLRISSINSGTYNLEWSEQNLNFQADSGGLLSIDFDSEILTFAGTANEIETVGLGNTVTIGLPNNVVVGTSLSSPTIRTTIIENSNSTQAASIDNIGNITAARDLTITGNLFVNGDTTQVNTETLTVEDTIIELGIIDGNPPTIDINKDLGILFNWYDTELRKAAVFWDDSVSRIAIAQSVTEAESILDVATYAPVEIGELWINDTAGVSQTIRHNGIERILENITIDAGSF